MAGFYVLGCVYLLSDPLRDPEPATFRLILSSALNGQAAIGGFLGAGMKEAIRFGVARGLFSNESGLGSAPIVAAAAMTRNPVRQALVSSTGTFWDTVVVCALMTRLVLVNSRADWHAGPSKSFEINGRDGGIRTRDPLNPMRYLRPLTAVTGHIS